MLHANPARGEVVASLAGEPRRLCLTLGALAELEGAFGLADWASMAARLCSPSAADLAVVLGALLRGGGEGAFAAELASAPVTPREAADAVAAAFVAAAG